MSLLDMHYTTNASLVLHPGFGYAVFNSTKMTTPYHSDAWCTLLEDSSSSEYTSLINGLVHASYSLKWQT